MRLTLSINRFKAKNLYILIEQSSLFFQISKVKKGHFTPNNKIGEMNETEIARDEVK